MKNNTLPLLSIIIPTKNRQYTCLYTIESALHINKEDIEIIIQDCSDSNELQKQIIEKFGIDQRIKYEYDDTKPSMTDNWNNAFARSKGIYSCGIGDDDAVLSNIYDISKWAKENNIEAVGHSKKYQYYWPDFTYKPEYTSKLIIDTVTIGKVTIYERNELDIIIKAQAIIPNSNYRKLPMAYHCLLAGSLIENLKRTTGCFLYGTSLDVYSAVSLGLLVDKYYIYDVPFTMPGACGASNSNRAHSKSLSFHFSEFKKIVADKRIPDVYNETFTIAESTQKAFSNSNDVIYSKLLDLPYLYADFLVYSFNLIMIKKLFKLMIDNKFNKKSFFKFSKLFFYKVIVSLQNKTKQYIKKILFKSEYLKNIIQKKNKNTAFYDAKNIIDAINILNTKNIL